MFYLALKYFYMYGLVRELIYIEIWVNFLCFDKLETINKEYSVKSISFFHSFLKSEGNVNF